MYKIHPGWRSMSTAPRNGTPILAVCAHTTDPYFLEGVGKLSTYGAHCEGTARAADGPHVIVWGGADFDNAIPDWWFVYGTDFSVVASPYLWMSLPKLTGMEGSP